MAKTELQKLLTLIGNGEEAEAVKKEIATLDSTKRETIQQPPEVSKTDS